MKRKLIAGLLLLGFVGCSKPEQVTLEFRIAEEEPAPGLSELAFHLTGEHLYVHDEVLLSQADVDSAVVTMQQGRPAVELIFTPDGGEKLGQMTQHNVGKRCAMFLDGDLVSAPRIMAAIHVGRAIIAGDFTEAEARRIAHGLSGP
jgi:preprotein translocase subunit SecD